MCTHRYKKLKETHVKNKKGATVLTEVLDSEVALLVVHFDGLRVWTADAVANRVTAHHNVLVLRRRPAHHDAVDQRPDVQRARLVRNTGLWWGRSRKNFRWGGKINAKINNCSKPSDSFRFSKTADVTIQVALKRLCHHPLGGRSRAIYRHGWHSEGVLRSMLETWTGNTNTSAWDSKLEYLNRALAKMIRQVNSSIKTSLSPGFTTGALWLAGSVGLSITQIF